MGCTSVHLSCHLIYIVEVYWDLRPKFKGWRPSANTIYGERDELIISEHVNYAENKLGNSDILTYNSALRTSNSMSGIRMHITLKTFIT